MKLFDLTKHVNYVHLVGKVTSISHITPPTGSSRCLVTLNIQTEYKGNIHPEIAINLVFWDRLANALYDKVELGNIINVEGRLTVRCNDEEHATSSTKKRCEYSVTGNKVSIVRQIPGHEPYLQEIKGGE